jgi:hypothetical protein
VTNEKTENSKKPKIADDPIVLRVICRKGL